MAKQITQAELKEVLLYDPDTGVFSWTIDSKWEGRRFMDDVVKVNDQGYIRVCVRGKLYQAHRLAWLYVYGVMPKSGLDHINHIRNDNRINNLRLADNQENKRNSPLQSNNKSGVPGVIWEKKNKTPTWRVQIGVDNKHKSLGSYDTLLDAVAARKAAEIQYGFHNNHGKN